MRLSRTCLVLAFLFLVGAPISARAAFIHLAPTADTRLVESIYSPVSINTNYSTDILSLYHSFGNEQRTLLQFDLGAIPIGATVTSASLTMTASTRWGNNAGNLPMDVYRVTQSWDPNTVSWNWRNATQVWSNAGGSYVGTTGVRNVSPYASNSSNVAEGGSVTWDITALASQWFSGTFSNFGLEIVSSVGNGLTFDSSEVSPSGRAPIAPVLAINFSVSGSETAVPELSSVLLTGLGGAGLALVGYRRRRGT